MWVIKVAVTTEFASMAIKFVRAYHNEPLLRASRRKGTTIRASGCNYAFVFFSFRTESPTSPNRVWQR
jgi:hypothetical protein